jgi:hypothetical protein
MQVLENPVNGESTVKILKIDSHREIASEKDLVTNYSHSPGQIAIVCACL